MATATQRNRKSPTKKWRGPHRTVGVADQLTLRTARAIAHDAFWGRKKDDYRSREVEVTIQVEHNVNQDSSVWVECEANAFVFGQGSKQRKYEIEAHLGDLPLIVLALQEAIRIGVEQGTFPEIRGGES